MANQIILTPTVGVGLQQTLADNPIALIILPLMRGEKGESGGAAGATVTLLAAIALSGHRAVYLSGTGLRYADAAIPNTCDVIGITTAAAAAGALTAVQTGQEITEPSWAWTAGAVVWLGTNGQLTQTAPTKPAAATSVAIGTALTATTILIHIHPPTNLI